MVNADRRQRRLAPRLALAALGTAALVAPVVAGAVAPSADLSGVARAAAPAPPSGFTTVWVEDFNGGAGSLPSSANWIFDIGHSYPGGAGNWGTGEIAYHTSNPANVSLDGNGNLRITPLRDGAGNWTSARIETQRTDFQPPAGGTLRIEGRMQLPNVSGAEAQGIWPAFWALGAPFRGNYWNWPSVGEIDIMENVNGANQVWGTLHCGVSPGGPCNETVGLGGSRAGHSPSLQSAFHTYAVEWDRSVSPEQMRWYVDGSLFHTVSANQVDATTWNNATNHGFFIILNVAVGGGWPGNPTAATVPGRPLVVDYVAVWSRGGGGTTPPTTPPPTTPPPTGGTRDAYSTIQAESFDSQSGLQIVNGSKIGYISNGDRALYRGVNFGSTPARTFIARVASGAAGGVSGLVEVRLDSPTAAPVGTFAIANTGGWDSFREVPGSLPGVTGTHDVYLTFTSGQPADYVDVDWLRFAR
jgi:beta-glucanase (GH16 family)